MFTLKEVNPLAVLLGTFLAIILVYLYPTYQAAERQDNLTQIVVHQAVTTLVDAARTKGYISPTMYSDFTSQLGSTGNVYDIEIEHLHKKYNPIYSDPADASTFQQSFKDYYDGHYSDEITKVLYPATNIDLNDEKRMYKMATGDFLKIDVKNMNPTMASILKSYLQGISSSSTSNIYVTYSGMILNEDY